jgi:hypothetical protein
VHVLVQVEGRENETRLARPPAAMRRFLVSALSVVVLVAVALYRRRNRGAADPAHTDIATLR